MDPSNNPARGILEALMTQTSPNAQKVFGALFQPVMDLMGWGQNEGLRPDGTPMQITPSTTTQGGGLPDGLLGLGSAGRGFAGLRERFAQKAGGGGLNGGFF